MIPPNTRNCKHWKKVNKLYCYPLPIPNCPSITNSFLAKLPPFPSLHPLLPLPVAAVFDLQIHSPQPRQFASCLPLYDFQGCLHIAIIQEQKSLLGVDLPQDRKMFQVCKGIDSVDVQEHSQVDTKTGQGYSVLAVPMWPCLCPTTV